MRRGDEFRGVAVATATVQNVLRRSRAISRQQLAKITSKLLEAPYKYRKGWPDLTLVRNRVVEFVEVKTTDKLHTSQLETISAMQPVLDSKFSVVRIHAPKL